MGLSNPGDKVFMQGSGTKPYELKNVDGVIFTCTCPAWRNAGGDVIRTCKHLGKERGKDVEAARVAAHSNRTQPALAPSGPSSLVSAALAPVDARGLTGGRAITADADYAQTVLDRAASEGRKLRQDEKAKIHGPPVLLAHSFEDADVDPTGWWMSEKLDGVRAYFDGSKFVSRQGNVFHAPDWFKAALPDHPLDGELWMGRQCFQKTISVVKTRDAGDRWRSIQYLVFDIPHLKEPFEERMRQLDDFMRHRSGPNLKAVTQSPCLGISHLKQELDRLTALGAEGLMIRKPGSFYEAGRSHNILKVKPWKDAEAVVVGHEPGKGRHKGRLGGLVVEMPDGKRFNVGSGLSDDDRRNPPRIGATVTYRFTETTEAGIPKCASYICTRDYE